MPSGRNETILLTIASDKVGDMETAKAFIIVTWFLVKCVGVVVFTVGAYTSINWLRQNVSFFTYQEEEDTKSPEWDLDMYR